MMLPYRHRVDYARRKGNVPYPCYYCMNFVQFNDIIKDEDGRIISFGTDGGVPNTCMAGLTCPTARDDCKAIQILELRQNYTRCYPSGLFDKLSKEYYLEILTDIKHRQPIVRSELVARAHKGYHTREQRINEMLDEGLIVESWSNTNEPMYSLTALGDNLAYAVSQFMDAYLMIREEGEIMSYELPRLVFEWVRNNPNSDMMSILDNFVDEPMVDTTVENLLDAGYLDALYNHDFSKIEINVTQKGIDVWKRITPWMKIKSGQYCVPIAEERSE